MKLLASLVLAASLCATNAWAIIGGADNGGPLARQTVMVLSSNGGVCSAVVLAPDAVLTAAHCVMERAAYRVVATSRAFRPQRLGPCYARL